VIVSQRIDASCAFVFVAAVLGHITKKRFT
jgi:hypothetical protein